MLRRHGAARVIGADISEGMIALAREEEAREPLGIEYMKVAVEDLGVVGKFDVVSAVYLLHYAPTREHLAAMCRTIAANIQPGGRLVAMNSNFGPGVPVDMPRYGWKPLGPKPIEEGMAYRLTFLQGPDSFEIQNYYYSHATYEEIWAGSN
jgi:2-polyprenyl-3-methyl-5-hydroxy-6-metoxy-1,4-benzoquinol methylase